MNGNEFFYHRGDAAALSRALAAFAGCKADAREVIVRPGPGIARDLDRKTEIPFDWSVHIVGGISRIMPKQDLGDKVWSRWPMIDVYVDPEAKDAKGGGIDLNAINGAPGVKFLEVSELAARYREALASKTQDVRGWTCGELASLDRYDQASRDAVAKMLKDPVPWVRTNAALSLPRFADAKSTLPALRDALKDAGNDAQLKRTLEQSIATIEKAPPEDEAAAAKYRAAVKAIHEFVVSSRVASAGSEIPTRLNGSRYSGGFPGSRPCS